MLCKTERSQESAQSAQKRDLILSTLLTDAPNEREYPEPEARGLLTEPNTPAPALSACDTVQNALAAGQLWDLGSRTSVSQYSVCTGHEAASRARDTSLQKAAGSFWGTSGRASACQPQAPARLSEVSPQWMWEGLTLHPVLNIYLLGPICLR